MGDFTDDPAFRVLLVIGIFGLLFWSTYGHAIAYYEDSLTAQYGSLAFDEGFKMAHLHSMVNSTAAVASAIAMPLIVSLGRRVKTGLAAIFGLSLLTWNTAYLYAALTTTAPTDEAFEAARTNALNIIGIPLSWIATVVGLIFFVVFIYDLVRKKPAKA